MISGADGHAHWRHRSMRCLRRTVRAACLVLLVGMVSPWPSEAGTRSSSEPLAVEFARLQDALMRNGHVSDPAAQEQAAELAAKLSGRRSFLMADIRPLSTPERDELRLALDEVNNDLMRVEAVLEVELGPRQTVRIVRRPTSWRVLAGQLREFPAIISNRSNQPIQLNFESAEGEPFSATELLENGRHLRVMLPVRGVPGASAVQFRLADSGRFLPEIDVPVEALAAATLHVKVADETGIPTPSRLYVRATGGATYRPAGARGIFTLSGEAYSFAPAEFLIELPQGPAQLEFVHGFEYRPSIVDVVVGEENPVVEVRLERWIDLPALGWFSGDGHVHMNGPYPWNSDPTEAVQMQRAEDVHYMNAVTANWFGDDVTDRQYFEGRPSRLSLPRYQMRVNEEYRSKLMGHMILYGLNELTEPLYSGFTDTPHASDFPLSADIADQAIAQGGYVTAAHPRWMAEYAIDVALEKVQGLEIMGYAAMYTVASGFLHTLWNTGFRTVATAGTDVMLNASVMDPVGGARAFVHVRDEFSESSWVDALRAGRTFVSTGPILMMKASGREPGDEIRLPAPGKVSVSVSARSQWRLTQVELLYNGRVVAVSDSVEGENELTIETDVLLSESGWLAARCSGPSNRYVFGGRWNPLRPLVAATSAIWVVVGDRPTRDTASAVRLLQSVDRFTAKVERVGRFDDDSQRNHMRETYGKAREIFQQRRGADAEGSKPQDPELPATNGRPADPAVSPEGGVHPRGAIEGNRAPSAPRPERPTSH